MYKIILDFDDCLINTSELKEIMAACGIPEHERSSAVFDRIREQPNYADFNLSDLVYPDALEFIQTYGNQCKIMTTSTSIRDENNQQDVSEAAAFQELKLKLSGVLEYVPEYEVLPGEKETSLRREVAEHGRVAFVDDRKHHVESGARAGAKTFWLRRGKSRSSPGAMTESVEGVIEIGSFTDLRREIEQLGSDQ